MPTLADTVARGKALREDMNIVFAQALVGVVHRSEVRKARRLWEAWCIDNGETLLAAAERDAARGGA